MSTLDYSFRSDAGEHSIKVLLLPPSCDVCGQDVPPSVLGSLNGKEVCKYCRQELENKRLKRRRFQ